MFPIVIFCDKCLKVESDINSQTSIIIEGEKQFEYRHVRANEDGKMF